MGRMCSLGTEAARVKLLEKGRYPETPADTALSARLTQEYQAFSHISTLLTDFTIAAMTTRGIEVSASFDGATDTELFVTFVREALVPTLRPSQVVVLDNLQPHRSPQVDRLIESVDARVLRLPPY